MGVSILAHVSALKMTEWEVDSCVHGYHVYEGIWAAALGEQIGCVREPLNAMDRYAVALKKDGAVIGHLTQKISRICSLFIRRGGTIECNCHRHKKIFIRFATRRARDTLYLIVQW